MSLQYKLFRSFIILIVILYEHINIVGVIYFVLMLQNVWQYCSLTCPSFFVCMCKSVQGDPRGAGLACPVSTLNEAWQPFARFPEKRQATHTCMQTQSQAQEVCVAFNTSMLFAFLYFFVKIYAYGIVIYLVSSKMAPALLVIGFHTCVSADTQTVMSHSGKGDRLQ